MVRKLSKLPVLPSILVFLFILWYCYNHFAGSLEMRSVTQMVGNGYRIFAMKFPPSPSGRQDLIIVMDNEELLDSAREATRAPIGWEPTRSNMSEFTSVKLTEEQWHTLDGLREAWCDTNPSFSKVQEGEPFYDVGISCCGGMCDKRIKIPPDELPAELVMLLEAVPSALEQHEREE